MDPMTAAALINIAGGIAANEAGRGDREAATKQMDDIQNMYRNIKLPTIEEQKLDLARYGEGQLLNNKQDQAEQLSMQDNLQNINLDPRLKQTQMNALETLQKISGNGFTPEELNASQQQRDAREGDLTSKLKQLQQQQDMRGVGNSDMALAQRMMEAQGSANRGAADARDLQAQAFKRSLDAVTQGANLAGNMDATDYSRQAQLAGNLNNREMTNLNQRANVNSSNVDRFNAALSSNVNRLNKVGDANTNLSNEQQVSNKGLIRQSFLDQMTLTGAKAGTNKDMANMNNANAARTAGQITGVASGIGSGLMAMGKPSDELNLEDDVAPSSKMTSYRPKNGIVP